MLVHMSESPDAHRVLVVDDEPNIVDVIAMALRFQGFAVESAGTGADALAAVSAFKPHLIVLDVMLPDMEGFEVARRLGAQHARVPIIYLTARDATEDKIRGLSLGGDDYVTKPFSLEELVARIRSILRRSGLAEPESSRLVFEDLELDEDAHEVSRAGEPVDLTATEYRLLRYFMLNPRRVLTRPAAARARLGLRLRRRRARARDLRELPAQEARRQRPAADPHGARRRLRAAPPAHVMASLRARLLAGVLALTAAALLLLGGITYAEQRSFLYERVDAQARQALFAVARELADQNGNSATSDGDPGRPPPGAAAAAGRSACPPGTYGERRTASGDGAWATR